jgi:VanZ family protein
MRKAAIAAGWAWAAAIVWLSLTARPPEVDLPHGDKLGHLAGYGVLMFWFAMLYVRRNVRAAYAALFAAMGIGLEFLQGYLGYRSYEVFDMYANTLGVALGWAAAILVPRLRAS